MNAFTLWTKAKYLRLEGSYFAVLYPFGSPSTPFHFAAYDDFCGGLYFAQTQKTYHVS